ncbi:MAG: nucleoside-diphosphate kinase [Planctomycetota bacterium]
MEKTLVILKPDCVARRLVGKIIQRFEQKGLQIVGMKLTTISPSLAQTMYAEHEGEEFYEPLIRFMTGGPVVVMCLRGKGAIGIVRVMLGPTFGPDAPAGTIRGDFGMSKRYNLVHGSDGPESAERELALFFEPGELVDGPQPDLAHVYDTTGPELV